MKRIIALVLSMMLLCGFVALAEADGGTKINCLINEGSYVIQIDDPEGDMGWLGESGDESIITLYDADLIEDTFVVRFDPVSDGDATVSLKHYTGIACDEMHTFDLIVRDGAVVENTSGAYTASPDPIEMDPYLLGQWQTADGMTVMTVEKNPGGKAWDMEIVGAASHDAYVFKTTVYYDCALDSFIYDKGKYWDVPITDGEDDGELGEAKIAGATGAFTLAGDASALRLSWSDMERPDDIVEFIRADGNAVAQDELVRRFSDTWVTEGFSAEIAYDEAAASFTCEMALSDDSFCDFSDCAYDAAADVLVCKDGSRYFATYNEEKADYDRDEVETGVTAVFTFDGETLTCEDSMGMLTGLTFMRLSDAEAADAAAEASDLFSAADMDAAIIAINREFAGWAGCEMHDIRYAGDDVNNAENLAWMCSLGDKEYAQVISFLSDFHSPVEGGGAWEADKEYRDWQWWLARTEGGSWELLTWGY